MNSVELINEEFLIKEGDTAKVFTLQLKNSDNELVDLQDCAITVVVASIHEAVLIKNCAITGLGTVQFQMTPEDKLTEGVYDAELIVVYPDGTRETFPEGDYLKLLIVANLESRGLGESHEVGYELLLTKVTRMELEMKEYVDNRVAESISKIDPSQLQIDLSGLAPAIHKHVVSDITDFEQYTSDEITDLYRAMFK